jgi:hypothetical protein
MLITIASGYCLILIPVALAAEMPPVIQALDQKVPCLVIVNQ